jgi:DNA repair exonuclease SbcCD ATPase subunit
MELSESLSEWIRISCANADNVEELEEQLRFIGSVVFSIPIEECSIGKLNEVVCTTLGDELRDPLGSSLPILAEALLIVAVSGDCEVRSEFVGNILQLDQGHQTNLMNLIQNGLAEYFDSADDDGENETEITCSDSGNDDVDLDDENVSSTGHDGNPNEKFDRRLSGESLVGNESCMECIHKDEIIRKMQIDKENTAHAESDEVIRLKTELAESKNKIVDHEMSIVEKEDALASTMARYEEAQARIGNMEVQLDNQSESLKELSALRDEIDILKPLAEKSEAYESQMTRLREKLDELNGVKQMLNTETAAHSETHTSLLAAEQQIEGLLKCKSQNDEYRAQHAEFSITIADLTDRLGKRDTEISELRSRLANLGDNQETHRSHNQQLNDELQATTELLRQMERVGGIGESLSEVNPELMQELQTLRSDNKILTQKLTDSSPEVNEKLCQELADQKAISSSLQQKWGSTTDALKEAKETIASLRVSLASMQLNHAAYVSMHEESCKMAEEDLETLKHQHRERMIHAERRMEHATQLLVRAKDVMSAAYEEDIAELKTKLSNTEEELASANENIADMKECINQLTQSLQKAQQDLIDMKGESERIVAALKEEQESALIEERERTRVANQQFEDERNKRRRVERERRLLEAELHRQRTQLQVAGNSATTGTGLENAAKELKSMQMQLDGANEEIRKLRNAGPVKYVAESPGSKLGSPDTSVIASPQSVNSAEKVAHGIMKASQAGALRRTGLSGAARSVRVKIGDVNTLNMNTISGSSIEHTEMADRRIAEMQREKREILARNLEENKEKIELSQKLMMSEKEVAQLKSKLTKITLEKERMERKLLKAQEVGGTGRLSAGGVDENESPKIADKYQIRI